MRSDTRTRWLLSDLCTELGFCLPPIEHEQLVHQPPDTVDAFVDAIFRAEGLNRGADTRLEERVRDRVAAYFRHGTT